MKVPTLFFLLATVLIVGPKGLNCFRISTGTEEVSAGSIQGRFKDDSEVQPPSIHQHAQMARFIVNQAEWGALGTISTREDVVSYPIVNIKSLADGPVGNGNGVPYMFITPMGFSAKDLDRDNRASLMMTLAQGPYCKDKGMDPMDPRCPRVILTGRVVKIEKTSPEYDVAKSAVFGRHPWLAHMPEDHGFHFSKLDIDSVGVLATFGPVSMVSVKDYFNPPTESA